MGSNANVPVLSSASTFISSIPENSILPEFSSSIDLVGSRGILSFGISITPPLFLGKLNFSIISNLSVKFSIFPSRAF